MNKKNEVNLLFFGDFGVANPKSISIGPQLKKEIEKADIVGINFEGCVNAGEIISPNKKAIPQSETCAKWCIANGINVFSLANNHIMDFGETGFKATLSSFPKCSLLVGAGNYESAYALKCIKIDGLTIGFLAGTSADFSSFKNEWDDKYKLGCAWIKSPKFTLAIIDGLSKCDKLFIISHAGVEYLEIPIPELRELYRYWIDLGISGVIASHPHIPQGIEIYKGKPIYYSLGNFIFEGTRKKKTPKNWNIGIAAKIKIIDAAEIEFDFVPFKYENLQCEIDFSDNARKHIDVLSEILTDDSKYMSYLENNLDEFAKKYNSFLLTSMNAVKIERNLSCIKAFIRAFINGKKNNKALLHQFREESTIATIIRDLKSKSNTYL